MVLCKEVFLLSVGNYGNFLELSTSTLLPLLMQAKHMIVLKDNITKDIIQFLEHCEGMELSESAHATCISLFIFSIQLMVAIFLQ